MMSHGWHYTPFVQKAKNLIDQGIIGDIESIVCHMASPTRELLEGKDFLRGADASGEIMFSPESNTWADPVRAGGGYGYAQMSHSLALTFLLDGPPNNFADLLTGKNPENWAPGYVGLRSTEILSTAYKSSVSGKPEKV